MKKFIIILGLTLLVFTHSQGQVHLSHFFELENEFSLENVDVYTKHWRGCLYDNTLSFCNHQVVKDKKKGYTLKLHRVNVYNGEQAIVSIVLPEKKRPAIWDQKYWIYDIFEDSLGLLITTQNEIFEYDKTSSGEFAYRKTIETEEADYTFRIGHELYGISQRNDYGFIVKRPHLQKDRMDSLFATPIPAAFLLQYGPNGFLKHYDNFFFFLAAPNPQIFIYDLSGAQVSEIGLNFANWQTMPTDYIERNAKLPYGPDRALHVFNTSTTYSFPLEIIPYSANRMLLVSHQYDSERETPFLALHLIEIKEQKIRNCIPVCTAFSWEQAITADEFPMYYNELALCLSAIGNGYCVQLVREANVDYRGNTGKEYKDKSEAYLQDKDPIMKIRVMKLKTQNLEQ